MDKFAKEEDFLFHPHDHKKKKDWSVIVRFMDDNLDYENINNSLDLGGGTGDVSYHILKNNSLSNAICADTDTELLQIAGQRHKNLKTLDYDINKKLPFKDDYFDMVSCLGTLHYFYIKNPKNVLREMVRVSKKYIMIDMLYKNRPWFFLVKTRYPGNDSKGYSDREVDNTIGELNLKLIKRVGTRNLFGKFFPSFGRTTIFLLKKNG